MITSLAKVLGRAPQKKALGRWRLYSSVAFASPAAHEQYAATRKIVIMKALVVGWWVKGPPKHNNPTGLNK